MGVNEVKQSIEQFGQALTRLEEALGRSAEQDDIVIDATIHRFEFTIELCWESLKKKLVSEGVERPLLELHYNRHLSPNGLTTKQFGWRC